LEDERLMPQNKTGVLRDISGVCLARAAVAATTKTAALSAADDAFLSFFISQKTKG
jgi:hypothetical protein